MSDRSYRCKLQRCNAIWLETPDGTYVADRRCFNAPSGKPMAHEDVEQLVALDVMEPVERCTVCAAPGCDWDCVPAGSHRTYE